MQGGETRAELGQPRDAHVGALLVDDYAAAAAALEKVISTAVTMFMKTGRRRSPPSRTTVTVPISGRSPTQKTWRGVEECRAGIILRVHHGVSV